MNTKEQRARINAAWIDLQLVYRPHMHRQVVARETRMARWEQGRDRRAHGYWEAYRAERARIPIEYPMPEGHVMFRRIA